MLRERIQFLISYTFKQQKDLHILSLLFTSMAEDIPFYNSEIGIQWESQD
jgi:hypothetical protein